MYAFSPSLNLVWFNILECISVSAFLFEMTKRSSYNFQKEESVIRKKLEFFIGWFFKQFLAWLIAVNHIDALFYWNAEHFSFSATNPNVKLHTANNKTKEWGHVGKTVHHVELAVNSFDHSVDKDRPVMWHTAWSSTFGGKESHTGQWHVGKHQLNMGQWSKRGVRLWVGVLLRGGRERGRESAERGKERE